jgi:phosphatidylserine/phosphatidylglycerophosphate/cardiolipin synthase-like enzyme
MKVKSFLLIFFILPATLFGHSEAYFSPDDHPTNKLLALINGAKSKIYAAVYMITDKNIAQALIDAKNRGVDVQVIIDQTSMNSDFGKGKELKNGAIELFVFEPHQKKTRHKQKFGGAIMHNKFALIDNQLWNGSFNWTKSANIRNQENVIITDDKDMYQKFEKHFAIIKNRCTHIAAPKQEPQSWWQRYWAQTKDFFVDTRKQFQFTWG